MIIAGATVVQVGHSTFEKATKKDFLVLSIPALGRQYYRGDFIILEDKLNGKRGSFEIVAQTQCEFLKNEVDEKGGKIPKSYTVKIECREVEEDIYKIENC